ncbi:hypothetical protein ABEU86_20110 [Pseudomonas paraversuta]|uniref:DUF3892 domain-containing protein n=1 Tax=Pseudomonas paraversuta TaxID=2750624 RepID=UPI003D2D75FE
MTDFCITAVRYNKAKEHIEFVVVREEKPENVGRPRTVSRAFVADLIRLEKATFQTRFQDAEGLWDRGARVHVLEEVFLTTDKNSTKRDNLGALPEF